MMLSGHSTPSTSHRCPRFPGSRREITGLSPYGRISSYSSTRPAFRSRRISHSRVRLLDPWLPAVTPPAGRRHARRDPRPTPRPSGGTGVPGGDRGAWDGSTGRQRLRGDGVTLLPGDRAGGGR